MSSRVLTTLVALCLIGIGCEHQSPQPQETAPLEKTPEIKAAPDLFASQREEMIRILSSRVEDSRVLDVMRRMFGKPE